MKRAAVLVLLALLLFGCSAESQAPEPAPQEARIEGLRLLESGAEPRRRLRDLPTGAGSERRALSLTITGEQVQGGLVGLTATPPVLVELDLLRGAAAASRSELGFSTSPFKLGPGELIHPNVIASMEASLEGSSGYTGTAETDESAALERLQFQTADPDNVQVQQLAASFGQTLALAAVRFPGEPVGVGARWTWLSEHRQTLGARIEQRNTATLLESDGGHLRVRMESVLQAERQRLSAPPLPETLSLDLTSVTGHGRAELRFEAAEILPVEAEVVGRWELRLIADQVEFSDEVQLLQEMTLSLAREGEP